MLKQWFVVIGLGFDIVGAITLGFDLLVSPKQAIDLGVTRLAGMSDEENLRLPTVFDRLRQAKHAKIGLCLLVLGFLLQLIGSWPVSCDP